MTGPTALQDMFTNQTSSCGQEPSYDRDSCKVLKLHELVEFAVDDHHSVIIQARNIYS